MKLWSTLILLTLLTCACRSDLPDTDTLVKEIYDQRVEEFLAQKKADCKNRALLEAESQVDSIVHDMLNIGLVDTVDFPERPLRPVSPDHIIGTVKKFDIK